MLAFAIIVLTIAVEGLIFWAGVKYGFIRPKRRKRFSDQLARKV